MKIACLQLDPVIGQVENNIKKADDLLVGTAPGSLDLLVLPELAFTGYNFPSLAAIKPYLEPTTAGVSTRWAIATAKKLQCHVIVGYPEISSELDGAGVPINYNSTVTISPDGSIAGTYRKSFLYYTDEIWAAEGSGFFCGQLGSLGTVSHGICMDINPYQFTAPWEAYEFAQHGIKGKAPLWILSTAWLTHMSVEDLEASPKQPDIETMEYWFNRMYPLTELVDAEPVALVFANRCGTEANENRALVTKRGQVIDFGDHVSYAGTSCVMKFVNGQAFVLDNLGAGEEALLVVDTESEQAPKYAIATRHEVLNPGPPESWNRDHGAESRASDL